MIKKCFKCNLVKDISSFYKHPAMGDGHLNKCKECNKKDVTENRIKKADYYKAYDRKRGKDVDRKNANKSYWQTAEGKANHSKSVRLYRLKHPEKIRARSLLRKAVLTKKIIKMPCEKCGCTERIHGHHDDYSKPLSVRWLCQKHHGEHHTKYKD